MEAEGRRPKDPASMEASSDRMSPKMLPAGVAHNNQDEHVHKVKVCYQLCIMIIISMGL
jgi:hypothetical protein